MSEVIRETPQHDAVSEADALRLIVAALERDVRFWKSEAESLRTELEVNLDQEQCARCGNWKAIKDTCTHCPNIDW